MGKFFRFVFWMAVLAAIGYAIKQVFASDTGAANIGGVLPSQPIKSLDDAPLGGTLSPELLKILVCPEDKGPLQLVEEGKYLLNPRNGYKYPVRNGIPVMLIEEGKKNRSLAAISKNGSV